MRVVVIFSFLFAILSQKPVAAQQTVDFLSIVVSEANSVFTQVNSILSSAASAASAARASASATATASSTDDASSTSDTPSSTDSSASSASARDTSSSPSSSDPSSAASSSSAVFGSINSSQSTPTSTSHTSSRTISATQSSQASSSLSLSSSIAGTSSVLGAATASGTNAPSSSGSNNHKNLAIILGCVLGALALGLLLLALLICCKRRRRGSSSPRHSALSVADDGADGWESHQAHPVPFAGSRHHDAGVAGAAPLMSEHPAYRGVTRRENPFAPVPPPPRRSINRSRPSLSDGLVDTSDPLATDNARPPSFRSSMSADNSHRKSGIAAGLAAAAAGGALMHEHSKNKSREEEATMANGKPAERSMIGRQVSRKPVPAPINSTKETEPWPHSPVSPLDPITETTALTTAPARHSQDGRRSLSRDTAPANDVFDQQHVPQGERRGHGHELEAGMAGLAAGAVGGAALSRHRNQDDRRRSRSSSSYSSGKRRSQGPLAVPGDESDNSNSSKESKASGPYSDALASLPHNSGTPQLQDLYSMPPLPPNRSPRNSVIGATGVAAPAAAVGAYTHMNRPSRPSPLSSEIQPDQPGYSPARYRRRSTSAPRQPFDTAPTHDYGAYPPFPTFPPRPASSSTAPADKSIVGDNGYPHLGIPRRRSGIEYDLDNAGLLGPQSMPGPAPPLPDERNTTMRSAASGGSDDSTWRLSAGMPGGWQRAGSASASPRNSRDLGPRRLRASDFAGDGDGDSGYGYAYGYGQAM